MRAVSSRDRYFFSLGLQLANDSPCNYKHAAIITKGSNILSLATNKRSNNKITRKYGSFCISVHAEIRALLKLRRKAIQRKYNNLTLYSCRVGKSFDEARISKPCNVCMELMVDFGVDTIVYFNGSCIIKESL